MADQVFNGVIEEGRGGGAWVASIRETLGKGVGDSVRVSLRRDDAPRSFEMPREFAEALAREPEASEFFDGLSFTHRKEMAGSIREAKKEGTRLARLNKAMTLLRNRQKPA